MEEKSEVSKTSEKTEVSERKPLSTPIKLFWGIGNGLMVLSTTMGSYFQTYWMTDIAKFTPATIGLIATINTVLTTFMAPLIGGILDATPPINKKWGRYRSWLIYGSIFAILTAPLNWIRFSDNEFIAAAVRIAIMTVAMIPGTCRTQADSALLTIVCKTPQEKSLLASRKYMYSNVFRLVSNVIVTAVVSWFIAKGLSEGASYIVLSVVFAVLAFFGFLAQFKLTEGYEGEGSPEAAKSASKAKSKVSIADIFKNLLKNPPLLWLFLANTATSCVAYILTMCATYYWRYVAENFAMMSVYSLCVNGLGILGTLAVGALSQKYDNVKMSRLALVGMLVSIALVRPLGLHNQWMFIIVLSIHQFFASFNYPLFVAGYANCTVYAEWKNGKSTAATVMGISGFPLRFAATITSWLIPFALQKVGYVAGEAASEATKAGIVGIYSIWGPIFVGIALIIMLFCYKLNNEKMAQIQAELDARK